MSRNRLYSSEYPHIRFAPLLILVCGILSFRVPVLALIPANSVILNIATSSYVDDDGNPFSVSSNIATHSVRQVFGITITEDGTEDVPGQVVGATPNTMAVVPYTLTNIGNGPDNYHIDIINANSLVFQLYVDVNTNGLLDEEDIIYNNDAPPQITPGEFVQLLLATEIPTDFSEGRYFVNLTGFSIGDTSKTDPANISAIDIQNAGILSIVKSADAQQLLPGGVITFTISVTNQGTLPALSVDIATTDFDNDGVTESRSGILIHDAIPPGTTYISDSFTYSSTLGFPAFSGSDQVWKTNISVGTDIQNVALFIAKDSGEPVLFSNETLSFTFSLLIEPSLTPQFLTNKAEGVYSNQNGEAQQSSNTFQFEILPIFNIAVDDTDDSGASSGSGIVTDPDDIMSLSEIVPGTFIDYQNEVWNLGTSVDRVNLLPDFTRSSNLPEGLQLLFQTSDGNSISDTNGDAIPDTGDLAPGSRFPFVTRIIIPDNAATESFTIAIKGVSINNPSIEDVTFNIADLVGISEENPDNVKINVNILVGSVRVVQPLAGEKIIAHEFDKNGNLVRTRTFLTDKDGSILFDENQELSPITSWMRDGFDYRISIKEEFKSFTYFLTPGFTTNHFTKVSEPGDTFTDGNITVTVAADGSRILELPLDPAGFVFDAVSGDRINDACATFYRCNDGPACANFTPVNPSRLDLFSNGQTPQENPQITGPFRSGNANVGTAPGAFQFQFEQFRSTDVGYYFVGINFTCGDPTLAEMYDEIELNAGSIFDPNSGTVYDGQPFYVDIGFPQASLLRIPLVPQGFEPIEVEKQAQNPNVSVGDLIQFRLTVRNPNDVQPTIDYTVLNVNVIDQLPSILRYRNGSTRINDSKSIDPVITENGRLLTWPISDLGPGESATIQFYALVTGAAKDRESANTAFANGAFGINNTVRVVSNTATARFRITRGVFTDLAYIIGKVFVDDNDNRIQDENEQGVEGVKIYTEFGRYVVTDSEGKYHIDNVQPGSHVLKLDETSLPPYSKTAILSNRHFSKGSAMCVDVYPGDLFKANFRLLPETPTELVESWQPSYGGLVQIERFIDGLRVDAGSGQPWLTHHLKIINTSQKPLFDLVYTERSRYKPDNGSSYLNGMSFTNPVAVDADTFKWRILLLEPEETVEIRFSSSVPEDSIPVESTLSFRKSPTGESIRVKAKVPVIITAPDEGDVRLTAYFDEGEITLTTDGYSRLSNHISSLSGKLTSPMRIRVTDYNHGDYKSSLRNQVTSMDSLLDERRKNIRKFLYPLINKGIEISVE